MKWTNDKLVKKCIFVTDINISHKVQRKLFDMGFKWHQGKELQDYKNEYIIIFNKSTLAKGDDLPNGYEEISINAFLDDEMFNVGDKVKNKNGTCFSNGMFILTIEKIDKKYGYTRAWFKETQTHLSIDNIELANPMNEKKFKVGDEVIIAKRLPYNTTGSSPDYNKTNGDVGKIGKITRITNGLFQVENEYDYLGMFKDEELIHSPKVVEFAKRMVTNSTICAATSMKEWKTDDIDFKGLYDFVKINEEKKMEEPKTQLEIKACEQAKNDAVQRAIEAKQKIYDRGMVDLINAKQRMINLEADLVEVKKEYKDLATKLKITKEDEKSLF